MSATKKPNTIFWFNFGSHWGVVWFSKNEIAEFTLVETFIQAYIHSSTYSVMSEHSGQRYQIDLLDWEFLEITSVNPKFPAN